MSGDTQSSSGPPSHADNSISTGAGRKGVSRALIIAAGLATTAAVAWGSLKVYAYVKRRNAQLLMVHEYRSKLICDLSRLQAIKQDFIIQLQRGLREEIPAEGKHVLMLPTFVTQMPTGDERGEVYAIDLGGTNFRVMNIQLSDERSKLAHIESHEVAIPQEVYTGPGTGLFDFLAGELKKFIDKRGTPRSEEPIVGFCFSFPMAQSALNKGILLDWTKGFTCDGVVGEDPVRLLSEALQRAGRPCRVAALLNDTVGVLAAHRYLEPTTSIGVIVGTGTNACYVDKMHRLTKWSPDGTSLSADTETAINTEWGSFQSELLPRVDEDDHLDTDTSHTGKYMFEKLVSGLYLGDVARRIILSLAVNVQLFGDPSTDPSVGLLLGRLADPTSFTTAHLAQVVHDDSRMLLGVQKVMAEAIGATPQNVPFSSRQLIKEVCEMVALRSAQMVAVAIDAILSHVSWSAADQGPTTVAIDGGVYKRFGMYRHLLQHTLAQLRGPQEAEHVRLEFSHDGSGLGAAVLAAAAVSGVAFPTTDKPTGAVMAGETASTTAPVASTANATKTEAQSTAPASTTSKAAAPQGTGPVTSAASSAKPGSDGHVGRLVNDEVAAAPAAPGATVGDATFKQALVGDGVGSAGSDANPAAASPASKPGADSTAAAAPANGTAKHAATPAPSASTTPSAKSAVSAAPASPGSAVKPATDETQGATFSAIMAELHNGGVEKSAASGEQARTASGTITGEEGEDSGDDLAPAGEGGAGSVTAGRQSSGGSPTKPGSAKKKKKKGKK